MYFTVEFVHKTCGIICGTIFFCSIIWLGITDSDTAAWLGSFSGFGTLASIVNYYKWQSQTYLNYREWKENEKKNRK